MQRYEELEVYKEAYRLVLSLYRYTKELPKEEMYGLTSQLRRASTSIVLNIAEGYGKDDTKEELKRYLRIAKGSAEETKVIIKLCRDIGYMEEKTYEIYHEKLEKISKQMYRLIESIN